MHLYRPMENDLNLFYDLLISIWWLHLVFDAVFIPQFYPRKLALSMMSHRVLKNPAIKRYQDLLV